MTKLHTLLETKDRKEQERRVEALIGLAREGVAVITIVVKGTVADFGVIGRPAPETLLQALDVVRDDILVAIAKQQAQQEEEMPEPVDENEDPTLEETTLGSPESPE